MVRHQHHSGNHDLVLRLGAREDGQESERLDASFHGPRNGSLRRCGPGVNTFDSIGTLEKWVEKGIAPDQMMGKGAEGLTRPLCPYPQYPEYNGTGDLKEGANWTCAAK